MYHLYNLENILRKRTRLNFVSLMAKWQLIMNVVNNVDMHVDNIPGYRHLLRLNLNVLCLFVVIVLLRLNAVQFMSRIHCLA